jgi:hypothetical protein
MGLGGPDVYVCFRINKVLREWSWSSVDFCPLFAVVALFYTSFCTLYSLPNRCIGGIAEENSISSAQTHLSAMSSQNVNFSIPR